MATMGRGLETDMGWLRREMLLPATLFAAIPVGFLIGIALFQLTVAMPEARRSRAETIASFQTLRAISAVETAVQDAERGQRGYLITGRDSYLQPYSQAKSELGQLVSQLQQNVRSDASEEDRLLALQAHLTTKMNELESTIATYRERGFEAARAWRRSTRTSRRSRTEKAAVWREGPRRPVAPIGWSRRHS